MTVCQCYYENTGIKSWSVFVSVWIQVCLPSVHLVRHQVDKVHAGKTPWTAPRCGSQRSIKLHTHTHICQLNFLYMLFAHRGQSHTIINMRMIWATAPDEFSLTQGKCSISHTHTASTDVTQRRINIDRWQQMNMMRWTNAKWGKKRNKWEQQEACRYIQEECCRKGHIAFLEGVRKMRLWNTPVNNALLNKHKNTQTLRKMWSDMEQMPFTLLESKFLRWMMS